VSCLDADKHKLLKFIHKSHIKELGNVSDEFVCCSAGIFLALCRHSQQHQQQRTASECNKKLGELNNLDE
jgi:hypothetical protein